MVAQQQFQQNGAQIPDNHRFEIFIKEKLPAETFWSLVLGTPQILDVDPVGVLVVLAVDQTLQLPDLLVQHEMLRTQVLDGVALLVE